MNVKLTQREKEENVRNFIEELLKLYTNSTGEYRDDLARIIQMLRHNIPLRSILQGIQNQIDRGNSPTFSDPTIRKQHINFWKYVLDLFIKHIPKSMR